MWCSSFSPVLAEDLPPTNRSDAAPETFSQQYTNVTRKILLAGIELERFSLNFRIERGKQPKLRKLRYFLAQEAGAGCGLGFEIVGTEQFGKGRRRPLTISKPALRGALATAMTGSIIAGSGSCLELGSNLLQSYKNKRHGYDSKTANKYVLTKLNEIDRLIAQRATLVAAHPDAPGYERAVIEGQLLHEMRTCFVNEYSHFSADTTRYTAFQNLFFLLNASYNTVGALGANVAYRAVSRPHLNGTANILFIVSGAMAAASPALSSFGAKLISDHEKSVLRKELKETPNFDVASFEALCKKLELMPIVGEGSLIPSLPATQRLALYTQSSALFEKQLDNETKTMQKLNKVALQTSLLGPAIGGLLMTQGILGTYGYYNYAVRPRKQLNQAYYGSVIGTVGTSMAVVGNAAWLLSSYAYDHKLKKNKQLPEQLIRERLAHLDDLEKTVTAM